MFVCATIILCLVPLTAEPEAQGGQAPQRAPTTRVTFNQHIAPIVAARCAICHRPGGPSFSLITYHDVRARARLIAIATETRFMPPWRPEPDHGDFSGTRRLSEREVSLFKQWVDDGSLEGEGGAASFTPPWTSTWQLGEPDLVVSMPEPYLLRADGDDMYRNFVMRIRLPALRYVKAWQFRPGNNLVVHHATLHFDRTGTSRRFDDQDPQPGYEGLIAHSARTPEGFFLDWAPGHTPSVSAAGMAWPIETGSDLVMMLHLRPSGKPETVQASVGLYFSEGAPSQNPVMLRLTRQDLDIPAGDSNYVASRSYTLPVDVDVYTVQPHAHYLAREVKAHARLPDGRTERLILIRNWAFEWQDVYQYASPVFLPAGTTIVMEWRYDNSDENPRNPFRPPRRVLYGQRTSNEMSELWLQVVPRNSADRSVLTRSIREHVLPQEIAGLELMLQAEPDSVALHDDAALLYAEVGQLEQSATHFAESVRLRPGSAAAHNNLGSALLALGRRNEAASHFQSATEIDADYGLAHLNLGTVWQLNGDLEKASRHYLEAVRINPESADARYNLGVVLQAQGEDTAAIPHFREVLRSRPDWTPALLNLAWALATARDAGARQPEESLRLAEHAISLNGQYDPWTLDVLAAALAAAGHFERAVKAAETALKLAERSNDASAVPALQNRLEAYRQHRPYRRP